MSTQTITAVFDSVAEADAASRQLAMQIGGVRAGIFTSAADSAELGRLGVSGPDRNVLDEAIRRGSVVLSATVPAAQFEAAADVIEQAGAVDLDAREAEWRGSGWSDAGASNAGASDAGATDVATDTGMTVPGVTAVPVTTSGATVPGTTSGATATGMTDTGTATTGHVSAGTGSSTAAGTATAVATGRDEVIPVVEETLRVGKRETAHGRVRVRSYVVETPVEEQVTLHHERVQVDRRPVDRPVDAATAFQDRTIEATETAEEAVIAKEARVREEVVIHKTADDEVRTVSDTVRRTEVEVADDRIPAGSAAIPPVKTTPDRNP
ncbi:MAG: hypothetical protein JWP04_4194 [Belnapia sp.]|nr:hypothetical protein [Belnapia sp.]